MKCLIGLILVGCGGRAAPIENPTPKGIENATPTPGVSFHRVFRDVLIDADHARSVRQTYELRVASGHATLVSTLETNGVAHLDAWPAPWTLVHRTELTGTSTRASEGLVLRLATADGAHAVELSCRPRTFDALEPHARLVRAGNPDQCVPEPRGTWVPASKTRVEGVSCVRDGEETDPIEPIVSRAPLDFVEGGLEWVDENNSCRVQGQGYRRLH